jgi:hypothetical protein
VIIRRRIIVLALLLAPIFMSSALAAGDDFVVFRAEISPLYIENASAPVRVLAIPWQDNKPTSGQLTVRWEVRGLNVNYSASGELAVRAGKSTILYLPPMRTGHYSVKLWAEWNGVKSWPVDQDFGVSPAPVPYTLSISQDGSTITFRSLMLNETGEPDPDFPFRLEIYVYQTGAGEALVAAYEGITNLTLEVPDEWRVGILIVDVIDVFGWRNGMGIDLSAFRFSGTPLMYDYQYEVREPFASRQIWYVGGAFALILVMYVLALRVRRREEYGYR